jgi:hypothetical protein
VQSANFEADAPADSREALDAELKTMAEWLGLADGVFWTM